MSGAKTGTVRAGVIGATGYTGLELLRLLAGHPRVQLCAATARRERGRPLGEVCPALRGRFDLVLGDVQDTELQRCDVVFAAAPNATAMQHVPELLDAGVRVIDLSADFRLRTPALWQQWYGQPHACPKLLAEAVYGLPELYRERIAGARLVANPGCYPTAALLALIPLLEERAIVGPVAIDAKSGVSGAGRKTDVALNYAETAESLKAYGLAGHRHLPEMRQVLEEVHGEPMELTFVPHLVPMKRGILTTIYTHVRNRDADVQALLERRYEREPFVQVLPPGSEPATGTILGCNDCRLAAHRLRDGKGLVLLSAIDNLVKGAAGQALQNMNLMFGFDEKEGLDGGAWFP